MPVLLAILALKYFRRRTQPTALLVVLVMLVAFYLSGALFWETGVTPGWSHPFLAALSTPQGTLAALGNPQSANEKILLHLAEVVLSTLVSISTLSAIAAGIATVAIRRVWGRRRRNTA